jgi:hypothetical protein
MSCASGLPLPHDLADEVETELLAARRSLVRNEARVDALEALLDTVWTLTQQLGRPATLLDMLATAPEPAEQERRRRLVQALRGPADNHCQPPDSRP